MAAALANARLRVADHGDHLSLFGAGEEVLQIAVDFMAEHGPPRPDPQGG